MNDVAVVTSETVISTAGGTIFANPIYIFTKLILTARRRKMKKVRGGEGE